MSNEMLYSGYGPSAPGAYFAAVTPDDDADLPGGPCRALWINDQGAVTVEIVDYKGTSDIFTVNGPALLPVSAVRVKEGGTATDVIAIY